MDLQHFWRLFDARHPDAGPWTRKADKKRYRQRHVPALGFTVSVYISEEKALVGVFFGSDVRRGVNDPAMMLAPLTD